MQCSPCRSCLFPRRLSYLFLVQKQTLTEKCPQTLARDEVPTLIFLCFHRALVESRRRSSLMVSPASFSLLQPLPPLQAARRASSTVTQLAPALTSYQARIDQSLSPSLAKIVRAKKTSHSVLDLLTSLYHSPTRLHTTITHLL